MKNFKIIFVISLLGLSLPMHSQSSLIKKGVKSVMKSTAKKKAKKEITEEVSKDLLRIGIKETGGKYTGQALGEQLVKRAVREKTLVLMEKEGVESFLHYGVKRSAKSLASTERSLVKHQLNESSEKLYKSEILNSRKSISKGPVSRVKETYLNSKLKKTRIYKELLEIQAKGPIKLTEKEIQQLAEHPEYLRAFIKNYTGDKKNFQEFFIRLAMHDKKAVDKILSNKEVMNYVKNSMIRAGGVHEWLMAKNFRDFLVNPKWGEDGPFLAKALTELVQKTSNVAFKFGGKHGSTNSTKFHNELAKIIDGCLSKEEVFLAVKRYAKETLSKESYQEFQAIFSKVFYSAA